MKPSTPFWPRRAPFNDRAPGAPAARAARRSRPRPRGADVLRSPDAVAAGAALRDDVDGAGEDPGTDRKNRGTPITTMWAPPGYKLVYKPYSNCIVISHKSKLLQL